MQVIRVEEAVGSVLCHDITKIVPGEFKGRAFKKGHVITPEDVAELLKLGKEHIYVWECKEGQVHENDAAVRLARAVMGRGLTMTEPNEGKVNLVADGDGMCVINEDLLMQMNMIDDIVIATRSNRRPVKKGDVVAGVRVVPLVIEEDKLSQVEALGRAGEVVSLMTFRPHKVGIVTTGSEVFAGRIKDKFGSVIKNKVKSYGSQVLRQVIVPDDTEKIRQAILSLVEEGADLILTTGGMSVDPDDLTPKAVKETGAEIVTYGAPVLPGSMMLVAYLGDIPILGLPGCVMYYKTTVFDLLLPSALAGERITKPMVARLGLGGLCLNCQSCRYPDCSFGTGA